MNATSTTERITLELGVPAFLEKREPDAVLMWASTRRLIIMKDGGSLSLSGDDIRRLLDFIAMCSVEDQL